MHTSGRARARVRVCQERVCAAAAQRAAALAPVHLARDRGRRGGHARELLLLRRPLCVEPPRLDAHSPQRAAARPAAGGTDNGAQRGRAARARQQPFICTRARQQPFICTRARQQPFICTRARQQPFI